MSELKSWVWPNVSSRRQIHFAILEGYCAAIAAAALFAIIAHVGSYQIDTLSIIMELAYVAIFVGLAFGIERRSRTEAVAALSIYVLNFC